MLGMRNGKQNIAAEVRIRGIVMSHNDSQHERYRIRKVKEDVKGHRTTYST